MAYQILHKFFQFPALSTKYINVFPFHAFGFSNEGLNTGIDSFDPNLATAITSIALAFYDVFALFASLTNK